MRHDSRLLLEFAPRGVEQILTFVDRAFRNRPRAVVAVRPERTTGMGEKNFERTAIRRNSSWFLMAAYSSELVWP